MKRFIFSVILSFSLATGLFAATPTPQMQPVTLKTSAFTKIESNIPCKIILVNNPDSAGMISYSITPAYKDLIYFNVDNDKLKCSIKKQGSYKIKQGSSTYSYSVNSSGSMGYNSTKELINMSVITIYPPVELKEVTVNGSGSINCRKAIKLNRNLSLTVNGSGDIKLISTVTESLQATVNGSGDIKLQDIHATSISATVNGSGDIDLMGVKAKHTASTVNGSGDIDIKSMLTDKLSASVNGSGGIEMSGKASTGVYSVSGSGDIDCDKVKVPNVSASVTGSGDIDCFASQTFTGHVQQSGNIKCTGSPSNVQLSGKKKQISVR